MSWNVRSSRLGAGSAMSGFLSGYHVEGVDQVAPVVRGPDPIGDVDVDETAVARVGDDLHRFGLHPRLPLGYGLAHRLGHVAEGVGVDRLEEEVPDLAAERRPHDALSRRSGHDHPDRRVQVLDPAGEGDAAPVVDAHREPEPATDEAGVGDDAVRCSGGRGLVGGHQLIITGWPASLAGPWLCTSTIAPPSFASALAFICRAASASMDTWVPWSLRALSAFTVTFTP